MRRHAWWVVLAIAWTVASSPVLGDDEDSLALPAAITPVTLAKNSARGTAGATAEASVDGDAVHSSASATASIDDPITIMGPVTTGSIGSLDASSTASQVSTGIGNIQQGVSATAISF